MNKFSKNSAIFLNVLLPLLSIVFSFQANALDITVKAKVVMPPCTVNNGNTLDIDFGDSVVIPLIDGKNYRVNIPYTIQCDPSAPNALKLQIKGSSTGFNNDALQTSENGLGIIFFQDGQPFSLNKKLDVSFLALPKFDAAPIKESGVKLTAGAFTAGATLAINYN